MSALALPKSMYYTAPNSVTSGGSLGAGPVNTGGPPDLSPVNSPGGPPPLSPQELALLQKELQGQNQKPPAESSKISGISQCKT